MGLGGVMECTADGKADKPPNKAGTPDTADPEVGMESLGQLEVFGQSVRGKPGRVLYGTLVEALPTF